MKKFLKKYLIAEFCALLLVMCFGSFCVEAADECPHLSTVHFKSTESTCISNGFTEGIYCTQCSSFVSGHEELPLAEHRGEAVPGKENTCTENGYTDGVFCVECKSFISGHELIPASHKEVEFPKQSETCTKDGYTAGGYCVRCETLLWGGEVIPAGHREVFVSEEPATCTGNGYTSGRYCTVCNVFVSGHVEIPFTDHVFTEKIIDDKHLVSRADHFSPAVYRYDCVTCTAMSDSLTFTVGSRLPLGSTSRLRAAQSTTQIRLDWLPVAGADGYRIYYNNGTSWRAVKEVKQTTVTFTELKSGSKFTFAVRAFYAESGKKTFSHDYTTIETATKALAPEKIAAKQNTSAIQLMWSKVSGATGYRIYYKSGDNWKICVDSTASTGHIFKNLPSGRAYLFAVRPYTQTSGGAVFGEYKTYVAATAPVAPKTAAVSNSSRSATVAWSNVNGADGYQLFYSVNGGAYRMYRAYTSPQNLTFSSLASSATITFAVRAVKKTSGGYIYSAYNPVSVRIK